MIKRFHDPRLITLDDLLTASDVTKTDVDVVYKVAIREAKNNHIKRDISSLLPTDSQTDE